MAADPSYHRLLTAQEFLRIDFGPDMKAELDNGVIHMMAGGSQQHAQIQAIYSSRWETPCADPAAVRTVPIWPSRHTPGRCAIPT